MVNALDAVNAALAEKWPGRFCYVDLLPQGFKRPSFFIERVRATPAQATRYTTKWTVDITITCFVKTDNYNQQSQLELLALQDEVLALFAGGSIPAGDRSIRVAASSGGSAPGEAFIDLTVEYTDDTQRAAEPTHGLMQDVKIKYGR